MEQETKKYLIIGGVLILTVSIGVVVWKKYQTSSTASTAASDQAAQDELSLEAAALSSNAYAGGAGVSNYTPQAVGAIAPTSLADEVLMLEKALGFVPSVPAPTTPVTSSPSGSASTPPASTPPSGSGSASDHLIPVHSDVHPATEAIQYHHGAPNFEMDGVAHEGVLVS